MWVISEDGTLVNLVTVDQVKILWYEQDRERNHYLAAVTITDDGSNVFRITNPRPDKSIAEKALALLIERLMMYQSGGSVVVCDFRKIGE